MPPIARQMVLYPAGEELWAYNRNAGGCKKLELSFRLDQLREELAEDIVRSRDLEPMLRFSDDDIWHIGCMIAGQLDNVTPYNSLYCESLTVAIIARLASLHAAPQPAKRGGLTKSQLRRSLELLESNQEENVSLQHLAATAGLSQSHFVHAFKASTGMPPHRWLLSMRVRRAQAMMLDGRISLADVALQAGFADQSHFTRVFRNLMGITPARWRRDRLK